MDKWIAWILYIWIILMDILLFGLLLYMFKIFIITSVSKRKGKKTSQCIVPARNQP